MEKLGLRKEIAAEMSLFKRSATVLSPLLVEFKQAFSEKKLAQIGKDAGEIKYPSRNISRYLALCPLLDPLPAILRKNSFKSN